jgi:hypothetical protein
VTLIGLDALTTEDPLLVLLSFLAIPWFHGVPRNRLWFHVLAQKQSIDLLLSLQLNSIGFSCFFVISKSLYLLLLYYGATISGGSRNLFHRGSISKKIFSYRGSIPVFFFFLLIFFLLINQPMATMLVPLLLLPILCIMLVRNILKSTTILFTRK